MSRSMLPSDLNIVSLVKVQYKYLKLFQYLKDTIFEIKKIPFRYRSGFLNDTNIDLVLSYPHQPHAMVIILKYQPSGAGGTRSTPATPHRLQNPK